MQNFAMRILFPRTDKNPIYVIRLRRDKLRPTLEVHLDLFSNKRVVIDSIAFLEWFVVSELENFFDMDIRSLDYKLNIEYGYYQGDEENLGAHKQLDDNDFADTMLSIILGYAKHMLR